MACSSNPRRGNGNGTETGTETTNKGDILGTPASGSGGGSGSGAQVEDSGCKMMDILFVIDNSGSMGREQSNLADNFPKFINVLDNFRDGTIDYRVAVTVTGGKTSSQIINTKYTSANGALRTGCDMNKEWIEKSDDNPADTFACLAGVGTNGSSYEMPLRAIQEAVSSQVQSGNAADFFRDEALLAVVVLTDEDDCSRPENKITRGISSIGKGSVCQDSKLIPTQLVADALTALKGEPERWAIAVIAGTEEGGCKSNLGEAKYATRLIEFADIAENSVVGSICEGDLSAPMESAMETFAVACEKFPLLL